MDCRVFRCQAQIPPNQVRVDGETEIVGAHRAGCLQTRIRANPPKWRQQGCGQQGNPLRHQMNARFRKVRSDIFKKFCPGGRKAIADGQNAAKSLSGTGDNGSSGIRHVQVGVNVFPEARKNEAPRPQLTKIEIPGAVNVGQAQCGECDTCACGHL